MPALVGKGLEVLKHVWPSNVSMFILQRFRMFTQAWSAVTLSLETRSERSDLSSGKTAGVIPAQLRRCCPAALQYRLPISWERCWVWAWLTRRCTSSFVPRLSATRSEEGMCARPERLPALRAQPRNAAVPPPCQLGPIYPLRADKRRGAALSHRKY